MSKIQQLAAITGVLAFLLTATSATLGQTNSRSRGQNPDQSGNNNNQGGGRQRGNFDPAQFQQRMLERYRERLEITDDAEWKAIQPLVQKVLDARTALDSARRAMFDRGNRGNRGGRTDRNNSDQAQQPPQQPQRPSDPAAETLQRAITEKASNSDLKAASARYLASRKAKQADLEKAQDELRMVLTQRQEAIAMLAGLL